MTQEFSMDEYFKGRLYSINHPGMSQDEMVDGYRQWIQSYEKDLAQQAYSAPKNAAMVVSQHYPADTRGNVRILDIGAGTGLVADELKTFGFVNIDALEPIKDMADMARQKGVYEHYIQEFLSDETPTTIPSNTYDCITGAGCFHENHIPWGTISELTRLVKPGGLVVISTRHGDSHYYKKLDNFVDELKQNGKLSQVERNTDNLFFKGSGCITYVLTVA